MAPTEQPAPKTFSDLPEDLQRKIFGALMEMREHFSFERMEEIMSGLLWDVERSKHANAANKINMEMCQASGQEQFAWRLLSCAITDGQRRALQANG